MRGRARSERGAALVEFALIAPLLFALLFGVFTGGLSLSYKNSMTNAVREGARLGATLPADSNWAGAVQDRVVELSGDNLELDQVCVKLVRAPSTDVWESSCTPGELADGEPSLQGIPAGDCAVLVWARRTSELQAVIYSRDLVLTADSVNRYEREC